MADNSCKRYNSLQKNFMAYINKPLDYKCSWCFLLSASYKPKEFVTFYHRPSAVRKTSHCCAKRVLPICVRLKVKMYVSVPLRLYFPLKSRDTIDYSSRRCCYSKFKYPKRTMNWTGESRCTFCNRNGQ